MSVYLDIKSLYPHLKVNWNVVTCKICIARRLVVDIFPWCNVNFVPFLAGRWWCTECETGLLHIKTSKTDQNLQGAKIFTFTICTWKNLEIIGKHCGQWLVCKFDTQKIVGSTPTTARVLHLRKDALVTHTVWLVIFTEQHFFFHSFTHSKPSAKIKTLEKYVLYVCKKTKLNLFQVYNKQNRPTLGILEPWNKTK